MMAIKQVLRPERLRQVPEQLSWVDQALVQRYFIDRCDARSAALYLFLGWPCRGPWRRHARHLARHHARHPHAAPVGSEPVSLATLLQQAQQRRG